MSWDLKILWKHLTSREHKISHTQKAKQIFDSSGMETWNAALLILRIERIEAAEGAEFLLRPRIANRDQGVKTDINNQWRF